MSHSPLALARRHVLGEFYPFCERIDTVPVYLDSKDGELLGEADESLGKYADAFLFRLPEDICKKLSSGHFTYSFDFERVDDDENEDEDGPRVHLSAILLTPRTGYGKPLPKRSDRPSTVDAEH